VDERFEGRRGAEKARRAAADMSAEAVSFGGSDGKAWAAENSKTWCSGDMSASVVEASI